MSLRIEAVEIGPRIRKNLGDLELLKRSITEVGLLHPIVVDENNNLIAGLRRLKACKELGWTEIPIHHVKLDSLVKGEFAENFVRENFTMTEMVAIKKALEPKVRAEAKKRKVESVKSQKGAKGRFEAKLTDSVESAPTVDKSRDIIAKAAGKSHDTMTKMERLVDAAKTDAKFEPLVEEVDSGKKKVATAYREYKRATEPEVVTAARSKTKSDQLVGEIRKAGKAFIRLSGSDIKNLSVKQRTSVQRMLAQVNAKIEQVIGVLGKLSLSKVVELP